jgi:dihydrodipicolinate synthase/N-acetylneuraminate lyase
MLEPLIAGQLRAGAAIPASPLALGANRKLDERRQRGLYRYYAAAGAGGIAVGVHTTQFAIRDAKVGLLEPVLRIAREEMDRADEGAERPLIRVAGICGGTRQAVGEAELASDCGYHLGLLSLAAMKGEDEQAIVSHCRAVAEVIPVVGFYLQPAVGGRTLPYSFWRKFCEIENVAAIKIAPFNRYQTLDVVRAVVESGRDDIALYTGNDDNIVADLVTRFGFVVDGKKVERRIVGGLLGHWSVWTSGAVRLLRECQGAGEGSDELLARGVAVTDSNAAFFDAANGFMGCIAGLHEVLRRQGLLEGIWCLDPQENLSPGQLAEIDRVYGAYPELNDDAFVSTHLDEWLRG